MNQVSLSAAVLEVSSLRYTPAGIPVIELLFEHHSEVIEAKRARQIQFLLDALALGELALLLADCVPGEHLEATGFLAPSRKGSRKLVLHLQQVQRTGGSQTVV